MVVRNHAERSRQLQTYMRTTILSGGPACKTACMGSASIYWFPDKAILGVTSGISHRLECTGMRAVIFRYPPHTRIFLSADFWLRHRRQAETWITPQYGRRTSFKSDSIGCDSQYEESNVRAIFPTHNPTHNSCSLVRLTGILAVPAVLCCKT